jgi:hypothetical protein
MMVIGVLAGACLAFLVTAAPFANPDSLAFEALARSLRAGHRMAYREPMMPGLELRAFRSPGYAIFLAGVLGLGVGGALAVQGALAGLTAALLGSVAHRLAGSRAAWIAFGSTLLWWQPWRFAGELMTETLYATLAALLLATLVRRPEPASRRNDAAIPGIAAAGVAGLVAAAAVLVRPTGFGLALAALAWLAARAPRRAAVFALVLAAAWAPWPLRNARVLNGFVPSLTSGGLNAWNGNTGRPIAEGWRLQAAESARGELGLDRMFWDLTRAEARAHPGAVLRRVAVRIVAFVAPPAPDRWQWWLTMLWPLALLAGFHAWFGAPAWRAGFALAALAWALQGAVALATVMNDRYRYPTDGLVVLAGALGAETLMARFGTRTGVLIGAALGLATLGLTTLLRAVF